MSEQIAQNHVSMRDMIQAGVHFGHRTRFWNPKMAPYIFGERQQIHIINLEKTLPLFRKATDYLCKVIERKGSILFVGTKRVARSVIAEQAKLLGMPYVDYRWLGGMLTNFKTVRQSIKRLVDLETMAVDGTFDKLTKKEVLSLTREKEKLERSLGGIKDMKKLPEALFVIDVNHEHIAVKEANKLGIPVIGVVDTNSDPEAIDMIIPGNDDAYRAVKLYITTVVVACLQAKQNMLTGASAEEFMEVDDSEGEEDVPKTKSSIKKDDDKTSSKIAAMEFEEPDKIIIAE